MKPSMTLAYALALVFVLSSHAGKGAPKTVHVESYTRKDGTVVPGHDRSRPNSGGGGTTSHRSLNVGTRSAPPTGGGVAPEQTTSGSVPSAQPLSLTPKYPEAPPRTEADKPKVSVDKTDPILEQQRASAAKGFPEAQYALGMRYLTGNGAPKDADKGKELILKAADQGSERAREKRREFWQQEREAAAVKSP